MLCFCCAVVFCFSHVTMIGLQEQLFREAGSDASCTAVPFLDIRAQNASICGQIVDSLIPVLSEAQFILGPAVERFEHNFAKYLGVRHCVGLNNGTSALHMALL